MKKKSALYSIILGYAILSQISTGIPLLRGAIKLFVDIFIAFLYPKLNMSKGELFRILFLTNLPLGFKMLTEIPMLVYSSLPQNYLANLLTEADLPFGSIHALTYMFWSITIVITAIWSLMFLFILPVIDLISILFLAHFIIPKYFKYVGGH